MRKVIKMGEGKSELRVSAAKHRRAILMSL